MATWVQHPGVGNQVVWTDLDKASGLSINSSDGVSWKVQIGSSVISDGLSEADARALVENLIGAPSHTIEEN